MTIFNERTIHNEIDNRITQPSQSISYTDGRETFKGVYDTLYSMIRGGSFLDISHYYNNASDPQLQLRPGLNLSSGDKQANYSALLKLMRYSAILSNKGNGPQHIAIISPEELEIEGGQILNVFDLTADPADPTIAWDYRSAYAANAVSTFRRITMFWTGATGRGFLQRTDNGTLFEQASWNIQTTTSQQKFPSITRTGSSTSENWLRTGFVISDMDLQANGPCVHIRSGGIEELPGLIRVRGTCKVATDYCFKITDTFQGTFDTVIAYFCAGPAFDVGGSALSNVLDGHFRTLFCGKNPNLTLTERGNASINVNSVGSNLFLNSEENATPIWLSGTALRVSGYTERLCDGTGNAGVIGGTSVGDDGIQIINASRGSDIVMRFNTLTSRRAYQIQNHGPTAGFTTKDNMGLRPEVDLEKLARYDVNAPNKKCYWSLATVVRDCATAGTTPFSVGNNWFNTGQTSASPDTNSGTYIETFGDQLEFGGPPGIRLVAGAGFTGTFTVGETVNGTSGALGVVHSQGTHVGGQWVQVYSQTTPKTYTGLVTGVTSGVTGTIIASVRSKSDFRTFYPFRQYNGSHAALPQMELITIGANEAVLMRVAFASKNWLDYRRSIVYQPTFTQKNYVFSFSAFSNWATTDNYCDGGILQGHAVGSSIQYADALWCNKNNTTQQLLHSAMGIGFGAGSGIHETRFTQPIIDRILQFEMAIVKIPGLNDDIHAV